MNNYTAKTQKKQEVYSFMRQYDIPLVESTKKVIESYTYSENTLIRMNGYNIEVYTEDKGYTDMLYIKKDGTLSRIWGNGCVF